MDTKNYLQSYGWKEGEALRHGGLKRPILVRHKKDTKGLGHETKDTDLWWENLFDGHLKGLEVSKEQSGNLLFSSNTKTLDCTVRKANSPLYRMFVKGRGLKGTVGVTSHTNVKAAPIDFKKSIEDIEMKLASNKDGRMKTKKKSDKMKNKKKKKQSKSQDKEEKKAKKSKKEKSDKRNKTLDAKADTSSQKSKEKESRKEERSKEKKIKDKKSKVKILIKPKEMISKENKKRKRKTESSSTEHNKKNKRAKSA